MRPIWRGHSELIAEPFNSVCVRWPVARRSRRHDSEAGIQCRVEMGEALELQAPRVLAEKQRMDRSSKAFCLQRLRPICRPECVRQHQQL
jgi:hypothetical protein